MPLLATIDSRQLGQQKKARQAPVNPAVPRAPPCTRVHCRCAAPTWLGWVSKNLCPVDKGSLRTPRHGGRGRNPPPRTASTSCEQEAIPLEPLRFSSYRLHPKCVAATRLQLGWGGRITRAAPSPSGPPRCARRSWRFAPASNLYGSHPTACTPSALPLRGSNLAGAVGFEPTSAGVKVRCLNRLATPQKNLPFS